MREVILIANSLKTSSKKVHIQLESKCDQGFQLELVLGLKGEPGYLFFQPGAELEAGAENSQRPRAGAEGLNFIQPFSQIFSRLQNLLHEKIMSNFILKKFMKLL